MFIYVIYIRIYSISILEAAQMETKQKHLFDGMSVLPTTDLMHMKLQAQCGRVIE